MNVVYVGMFVFKELYLMVGFYVLFIGLVVVGWCDWSCMVVVLWVVVGGLCVLGGGVC